MSRAAADEVIGREHRPDLVAHCYRLTGSVHAAVAAADVALAALSSGSDGGYDGLPARLRLHRLASEAALAGLAGLGDDVRRPLPTGLGGPSDAPEGDLAERPEVPWLEPLPDACVAGSTVPREALRLSVVAGLQLLPADQRAVLALGDLPGWPVTDVAEVVGRSPEEVVGELARARRLASIEREPAVLLTPARQRDALARWRAAFEEYDVPAISALLADDAVWEMPPFSAWFRGSAAIARLIRAACPAERAGDQVLLPVEANGQPGFALYMRDPATGAHRAFQIQVLTLTAAGVVHAVAFFDLSLFDAFGLPQLLGDLADARPEPVHVPEPDRREESAQDLHESSAGPDLSRS